MSFRLVPLIKKTAPIIDLQRPILLIGRHMDCDVRLDTPKISRRHCCIAMAYDRLLIRDLGSRNGVRLNGRMIEEGRLESGDEVAIGPIVFRLEPSDERPEAPAARPAPAAGRPAASPNPPPRPVAARPRSPKPDSEDGLVPLDDF
jgi:pSer/pThr/pTyr-binding forkhead associated (FHA) protein